MTEPFLREVGLPFASVNEAPTSAKRTSVGARGLGNRRGRGGVGADDQRAAGGHERGRCCLTRSGLIGDRRIVRGRSARARATGSVAGSVCVLEVATQTFADAAGVAPGVGEHALTARAATVAVVAKVARVRLFTSHPFRRGVFCPTRYQPSRAQRRPGRCTSPDSIHSKAARDHRESRRHSRRLAEGYQSKSERPASASISTTDLTACARSRRVTRIASEVRATATSGTPTRATSGPSSPTDP